MAPAHWQGSALGGSWGEAQHPGVPSALHMGCEVGRKPGVAATHMLMRPCVHPYDSHTFPCQGLPGRPWARGEGDTHCPVLRVGTEATGQTQGVSRRGRYQPQRMRPAAVRSGPGRADRKQKDMGSKESRTQCPLTGLLTCPALSVMTTQACTCREGVPGGPAWPRPQQDRQQAAPAQV